MKSYYLSDFCRKKLKANSYSVNANKVPPPGAGECRTGQKSAVSLCSPSSTNHSSVNDNVPGDKLETFALKRTQQSRFKPTTKLASLCVCCLFLLFSPPCLFSSARLRFAQTSVMNWSSEYGQFHYFNPFTAAAPSNTESREPLRPDERISALITNMIKCNDAVMRSSGN